MRFPLTIFRRNGHTPEPDAGENGRSLELAAVDTSPVRSGPLAPSGATAGSAEAWGWFNDMLAGGTDTNPDLNGRLKYDLFREMAQTDPAIRSLLFMQTLPIRRADFKLEPAPDDPDGPAAAEARADFGRWQLGMEGKDGRLDLSFDGLVQLLLTKLKYGAHGAELVWALPPKGRLLETWRDADGDEHLVIPLDQLAPRFASTVYEITSENGRIKELCQDVPGAQPIPGGKLAWFVNEREGAGWFGASMLRPVYGGWKAKVILLKLGLIAYDRWAVKVPSIWHPAGKEKQAAEVGRTLRSHERSYATFVGPRPTATSEGGNWDISFEGGDIHDPIDFLRYCDQQIAMAGLQHFSSLGTTESGHRALGEVLAGMYYMTLQALAEEMAEDLRRQVLRRVWDVNFGAKIPVPRMTVSKIEPDDLLTLSKVFANLASANLFFTDEGASGDIREKLNLPDLPDGVGVAPLAVPQEGGSIAP